MGEVATVKEEFREALEKMLSYCLEHGCIAGDFSYEVEAAARKLEEAMT
jgi:hypothetical protein